MRLISYKIQYSTNNLSFFSNRYIFLFLRIIAIFFSFTGISNAQGIMGKISDKDGQPIPFANIYIQNLTRGVTTNSEGKYKLDLPPGEHLIFFQYLGYKTEEKKVTVHNEYITMNITLQQQQYMIPEVRVYADGLDPAYHVMRKAIAMAQYYRNQVASYDCRVYLKGSGIFESIPWLMEKQMKKEGIEEGKHFITENITDVHFELPDKITQKVISVRSTSKNNDMDPMEFITISLYDDIEEPVSPLSKRAFSVYRFKLENTFYDKGRTINKIKVIPKRKGYDLYSGYIFIAEDYWNIHSAELRLEQELFTVKLKAIYSPVKEDVWMPVGYEFDINASAVGFKVKYKYLTSVTYSQIKINSKLNNAFLTNIKKNILEDQKIRNQVEDQVRKQNTDTIESAIEGRKKKISELSQKEEISNSEAKKINRMVSREARVKKDTMPLQINEPYILSDSAKLFTATYWDTARPVPLTDSEQVSFAAKDSMERLMVDEKFKDSLNRVFTKFQWSHLIWGTTYKYKEKKSELKYKGLFHPGSFLFNTVDGSVYLKSWEFSRTFEDSRRLFFKQSLSYAFDRDRFLSHAEIRYLYDPIRRAFIYCQGGRKTSDLNNTETLLPSVNMSASLLLKENGLKLYEKDYFLAGHRFDIVNGLILNTSFEYAERRQLVNHSDFYLSNPLGNEYTPNLPNLSDSLQGTTDSHSSLLFTGVLTYTPRYYYRIRDDAKHMAYSDYPTFSLMFQQGVKSVFHSGTQFNMLELSVRQYKDIRRIGNLAWQINAGKFFSTQSLYFADHKHFSSNEPYVAGELKLADFRLLPYYSFSTPTRYLEAHARIRNDRLLLKRLPVLNKTLIIEYVYINYLSTPVLNHYYEIGYGMDQIFLLFGLEVMAGFEGAKHQYTGFKISIPLLSGIQSFSIGE